ncbi:circadian-associated transcriptional repressor-like [Myxocyprinus asiaticus]|uniref:circadian-associated transcriptional repressor-like n=1 Tax=Myxocyprinus asiaticus TaxID=70543 RepID=UPI002222A200|nr:circadian-associated transcriptional repressor-like [Myxocyprinus asiaticus]
MLSAGSPSKWQVQNSLSSSPSLLYSESDQTEDESEVFSSEGEASSSVPDPKPCFLADGSNQSSKSPLTFLNQRSMTVKNGQTWCSLTSLVYTGQSSESAQRTPTEGDLKFARKCSELQRYIRPLMELLNGLKMGRYDKGLSTFQQSVAMERLRKILGVLQKPELGEKYMGTLLQLEIMLKVWFPHIMPQHRNTTPSLHSPIASMPPRWNQDQLHIPVKKRRLSWSDSDSQSAPSCKRVQDEDQGQSFSDTSTWLSSSETTYSELEDDSAVCTNQKEMTSELIENSSLLLKEKTRRPPPLVIPPSATDGSTLGTQDSSVSSTTPISNPPADLGMGGKDVVWPIAKDSVDRDGPKNKCTLNYVPQRC